MRRLLLLLDAVARLTAPAERSTKAIRDGYPLREASMKLIMPIVGTHLLIASGLGAIAQVIFGTTSFF
jgi:hypothetical protein